MLPDNDQQANIDRTVGAAAIKKMAHLAARVNQEDEQARRFSIGVLIAAVSLLVLVLLLVNLRPDFVAGVLRVFSSLR